MEEQQNYFGFDDDMFQGNFEKLEKYKFSNGIHKIRFLPPYEKGTLYFKVDLHWGYTDQNGQTYPVKCVGENICPICQESKRIKAQSDEMMAHSQGDPQKIDEAKIVAKRANDIKRKPTYIYQILDFNGSHKQINFSYKQHMSVYGKIRFFWNERKINVTDPNRNMIVYVDRQGKGNQSTYNVEILEESIKKIDMPKLAQLHELHKDQTVESLAEIVKTGFLPTNKKKDDQATNNFHGSSNPVGEPPSYMTDVPPQENSYPPHNSHQQNSQNYNYPPNNSHQQNNQNYNYPPGDSHQQNSQNYNYPPNNSQQQNNQGNQNQGVNFQNRMQNQVGTPSHSTTEGVAGTSQPSHGNPASSSPHTTQTPANNVQMNNNQQQAINETVGAFNVDDIPF